MPPPSRPLLEWKGSHLDVIASPDGRFLVTSMQENALHGWRVADSRNMRMTGYPAQDALAVVVARRPLARDLGRRRLHRLAVQGQGRADGQGAARMRRARGAKVSQVAFHPRALVVAIGYADGSSLLCRLADAAEILVREPPPATARSARWPGTRPARGWLFGLDNGGAGLLTLPA